ncbi:radical SAM/SPASM domain-containing protein [Clostridium sporogenes]|uniref:radical SAM/SPASM domain-containing protein n=1 Tax=Clostridium sporogenes TaxID=1509 RepID=UPI0006B26C19|nr:radical SAM protein [Clostridium sporogenes]KOY65406.1 hypothetical protein AN649_13070 [Clostridium sporogenes]MDS1006665.1 radical SAM protein [Clostridium sporogenes]
MFQLSQIQFDITNGCNMSCNHCRNGKIAPQEIENLTLQQCKQLLDEAKSLGCEWVNISGGEPLLHKDVYEIISYASDKAKVILLTNGYLVDKEVARKLKNSNVTLVQISLDSSVPDKHDKLRNKKGTYNQVIRAVHALQDVGIEVCFMVTLSKINYHEFIPILDIADKEGVSFVNFRRLISQGNGSDNYDELSLSKYEIKEFLATAKKYENKYAIGICLFPFYFLKDEVERKQYLKHKSEAPTGGCSAGVFGLAISNNGDILLCPHIPIALGNIKKNSLTEVWSNNPMVLSLRDRSNLKGKCGKCNFNNICGGCRAYPYQITGDIFGEDDFCTEF